MVLRASSASLQNSGAVDRASSSAASSALPAMSKTVHERLNLNVEGVELRLEFVHVWHLSPLRPRRRTASARLYYIMVNDCEVSHGRPRLRRRPGFPYRPPSAPAPPSEVTNMDRLISPALRQIADDERQLLEALLTRLEAWEARPKETARLREAITGLEDLFLMVITGEFNAGKSKLVNVLLGGDYVDEGVTPTTQEVQVLVHGENQRPRARSGFLERALDAPLLRELHLVDTPGANAIIREHEALTRDFLPRADLILFVTSADRPFSESERQFLIAIRRWGKAIVFVINKADLLADPTEQAQVLGFVRGAATALLEGDKPKVFLLSARQAQQARAQGDEAALEASGWPAFEHWIQESLSATERLRLKLENPLGIAQTVIAESLAEVERRQGLLSGDASTLAAIDQSLDAFQTEGDQELAVRLDRVDRLLMQVRERGEVFLEEQFRLSRLRSLMNAENLRGQFEREVVADSPKQVAAEVDRLVDWSVDREFATWRSVEDKLRRLAERGEGLGDPAGAFGARRQALLGEVNKDAGQILQGFDPRSESVRIAADVQDTLTKAGLAELGALGVGLLVLATHAPLLDFTGTLTAGTLAVFGLTILPQRRRQAAKRLRAQVDQLRAELRSSLSASLARETVASVDRMRAAYAPYARFVGSELERLISLARDLAADLLRIEDLRLAVDAELRSESGGG